jgi:hypothetical protein
MELPKPSQGVSKVVKGVQATSEVIPEYQAA